MELENPLPRTLVLLSLALPLVFAAGVGLSRWASRDRGTQRATAPALAIAAWLVAVTSLARVTRSFPAGFVAGTLALAAGGAAYSVSLFWSGWMPRARRRPRWPVALFTLAAVVAIVPAVRLYFADEVITGGHLNIVGQLQNGAYPPRHVFFPRHELEYHYGFDVLAAMASALLHSSASVGIDVCTIVLWVCTATLAAHLGRRLAGARHGVLTAAFAMFGGGFPFMCAGAAAPLGYQLTGYCGIGGLALPMPTAGYFFQHPFGLGIPVALAVLCLLSDRASGARPGRYVCFGLLLLALFLGQVVLFCCLFAALAVSEGFVGRSFVARRALSIVAVLAIVAVCARLSGGFTAAAPHRVGSLFEWHLGVGEDLRATVVWQLRVYALLLPLGLVGIVLLRRERLVFALLAAGCLVTPNVVRYTKSWDIVKFAAIAVLILSITASVVVVRLLRNITRGSALRADTLRRHAFAATWSRRAGVAVAALLTAGCVAAGLALHLAVWLGLDLRTSMEHRLPVLSTADRAVLDYLRRHVGPHELVLRAPTVSLRYSCLGGLSTPWLPEDDGPGRERVTASHFGGVGVEQRAPRQRLLESRPDALSVWVDEGITWFVVGPREPMREIVVRWVAAGEASVAFDQGPLLVVHAGGRP